MVDSGRFSQLTRFLIGSASLGITLVVMNRYAGFIATILVAIILAILFIPLLGWLERKGVPRALAFIITLALVVVILVGLFLFLILSIQQLSTAVPVYASELDTLQEQTEAWLSSLPVGGEASSSLLDQVDLSWLIDFIGQFLAGLLDVLSDGVVVLLVLAFLLIGSSSFSTKAERLIAQNIPGLKRLYKYNQDIRRYILITNNVGLAAAAINTALLAFIGVDFALLWGVLSYLMSYIPMIGFFIALIPPTILALLEFGWPTALFIVVAYVLINSAIDDVIKPRLMGEGLDLAPVIVFVSVIFWGLILGPLGGILAVPVTLGIKELVLEPDPDNQWIAELISGHEKSEETDAAENDHSEESS